MFANFLANKKITEVNDNKGGGLVGEVVGYEQLRRRKVQHHIPHLKQKIVGIFVKHFGPEVEVVRIMLKAEEVCYREFYATKIITRSKGRSGNR